MLNILLLGAVITGSALAAPGGHGPRNWSELKGKNACLGVTTEQVDQTMDVCRLRGLSVADADRLLAPVYAAKAENLPVGCIYEKIDEGLAKQVGITNILMAAEARLACMRQAKVMVSMIPEVGEGHGAGPAMLLENTGMALESGLDPEVVTNVFQHNGHRKLGRLAHAMEVAETLHLEGFEDEDIRRVLIDFLDRNLNRHEMFRAVGVLKRGLAKGLDFETVYATLWISSR